MNKIKKKWYITLIFNSILLTMTIAMNACTYGLLVAKITFAINIIAILIIIICFIVEYRKEKK